MTIQDPKLKVAMQEILNVVREHDIAAVVFLADGLEHGEFRIMTDAPSWSMINFLKSGRGVHLKGYTKSKPLETNRTVNALAILEQMTGETFLMLHRIYDQVKTAISVEEGPLTRELRDDDT